MDANGMEKENQIMISIVTKSSKTNPAIVNVVISAKRCRKDVKLETFKPAMERVEVLGSFLEKVYLLVILLLVI